MTAWQKVSVADYRKLRDARLLVHYGTQWLARATRAYLKPQPGDAQTGLAWDDDFCGLVTHALPDGTKLGLRIPDLALCVVGGEHLSLDGRAEPEVALWLAETLAKRGFPAAKLAAPAPYEMPHNVVALGARYSTEELAEPLAAVTLWFANANGLLADVRANLLKRKLKVPEVRCLPQHLNTETVVHLGGNRAVGAGFCPGDEFCDEPYFYISIYPEPYIPALPLLPPVGHWHSYKFIAALAPAHKIVASLDQPRDIMGFFDISTGAALEALQR